MNVMLDNLFDFHDFSVNFSYPKKLVKSTIEHEYIKTKPNFRYKKVNIIMGANASGKTSFGKALRDIFNFIANYDIKSFYGDFFDIKKHASFSIDFLTDDEFVYRVNCTFSPDEVISLDVFSSEIVTGDSYETCIKRLEKMDYDDSAHYSEKLKKLPQRIGWLFTFPKDDRGTYLLKDDDDVLNLTILNAVLKTLDTSITEVVRSNEVKNSYIIRGKCNDIFVQNGEVVDKNILSSGTKAGLDIAFLLSALYKQYSSFYYCDEQFSFIQSDVEIAILSLMISFLKQNMQLFFTTHNLDILDMNLPVHSFMFLRKNEKIEVVHPEDKIKKNDLSLRNAVKNDVFDISPNINKILSLDTSTSEV